MRNLLIICVLIAVSTSSCSLFGEREDRVLMPLLVGNEWTYTVTERGEFVAFEQYRVTRHVKNRTFTFAELLIDTKSLNGDLLDQRTIYAINESGLSFYESPSIYGKRTDHYRFPMYNEHSYNITPGRTMCASEASDIEVPAGTFDVMIYGLCDAFVQNRTMISPGIGIVFMGNYETRAHRLTSFTLN